MHRFRVLAIGVAGVALLAGCVDQRGNAGRFCERNAEVLEEGQDDEILSKDQAVFLSDELEKTMRYAEDSTRTVRRAARKLADAYADVRAIAGDDDVDQDDLDKRYAKLKDRRVTMRTLCADVLSKQS